jgi:hypothetical protein
LVKQLEMSDFPLRDVMERGGERSTAATLSILQTAAASLDSAHASSNVHGNLSPARILVSGIENEHPSARVSFDNEAPVQTGLEPGAPPEYAYYMAPEKILGSPPTGKSDQFSLAVIAYELLCGGRPFEAPNLPALFHRICTKQPEGDCEHIDQAVHRVLNRALAKNPEDRFANCTSFIEALHTALDEPVRSRTGTQPARNWGSTDRSASAAAGFGQVRGAYLHRDEPAFAPEPEVRRREAADDFGGRERTEELFDANFAATYGPRRRRRGYGGYEDEDESVEDPRLAEPSGHYRRWLIPAICLAVLFIGFFVARPYLPFGRQQSSDVGGGEKTLPAASTEAGQAAQSLPPATSVPAQSPPAQALPAQNQQPVQSAPQSMPNAGAAAPPPASVASSPRQESAPKPQGATQAAADRSRDARLRSEATRVPAAPDTRGRDSVRIAKPAGSALPTYIPRIGGVGSSDPLAVATVEMLTTPPGAKIVVDGRPDIGCQAPCTLSLTNGRHTLTAQAEGFGVARRIFNVPQDSSLFISLPKGIGTLVLSSQPPGSSVRIDGKEAGTTPVTVQLPAGTHQIDMVQGTQQHRETIEVQPDALQTRTFAW